MFKNEPNVAKELKAMKNAVFTNHIAGKTLEGEQGMGKDLFMQVNNMF